MHPLHEPRFAIYALSIFLVLLIGIYLIVIYRIHRSNRRFVKRMEEGPSVGMKVTREVNEKVGLDYDGEGWPSRDL